MKSLMARFVRSSALTLALDLRLSRCSRDHGVSVSKPLDGFDTVVGVVIVDHGSRRTESNAMLEEFVELYK
jgi:hypothetical protein